MRLRRGKSRPRGSHSSGISEMATPPDDTIFSRSGKFSEGMGGHVAREHGDRSCFERYAVSYRVDAARKARHDRKVVARQPRTRRSVKQARRRGVARSDNRHAGTFQYGEIAARGKQRRRTVNCAQQWGIFGIAHD